MQQPWTALTLGWTGVRRENLLLAAHFLWLNWVGGLGFYFCIFLSKHTFGVFCLWCGSKEDQVKKQKLDEEITMRKEGKLRRLKLKI